MLNRELLDDDMVVFSEPEYDDAIIGTTHDGRVVYDYDLMVGVLMERDGMTWEEAAEFIDYNTIRSLPYVERSPVVMYPLAKEEE